MTPRAGLLLLLLSTSLYLAACVTSGNDPIDPDSFIFPFDTLTARSTEWQRTYGSDPGNIVNDADDADDGSIFVAGTARMHDTSTDYYLMKLNPAGDLLWERSFGGLGKPERACSGRDIGRRCGRGGIRGIRRHPPHHHRRGCRG